MQENHLNPEKSLFEQDKVTNLYRFLQAIPYLTFSDTGLNNVAKRFGLTLEQLKQAIAAFEKGSRNDG